jgi:hypothetical protein
MLKRITASPTVDTNIYAAGDLVGGLLTFGLDAFRPAGGAFLRQALLYDLAKQDVDLDLLLLSASITPGTDNAAFDLADADMTKVRGLVNLTTFAGFNDSGILHATGLSVPITLDLTQATLAVYAVLISRGTPTYGASDLTLALTFESA